MPYYFSLPLITEMTKVQQSVLDQPGPVAISGGPGTGKSVVSLWRHIRNHEIGKKKSLILTYTKTLAHYLSSSAANENVAAGNSVHRTFDWMKGRTPKQDELIIDEAQDVSNDRYLILKELAPVICYGADDQQILFPDQSTTQAQLETFFPENHPYELDQNFRNSFEILHFIQALLPNYLISHNVMEGLRVKRTTGIKPQCMLTLYDNVKQKKAIVDIIKEFRSDNHNIGILLPLQGQVDHYYKFLLNEAKIPCTRYFFDGDEIAEIENVHITTFKSCKGIEFDTVIFPDFSSWKNNILHLRVVNQEDYYVALTRAKRNLYLLCGRDLVGIPKTIYDTVNL